MNRSQSRIASRRAFAFGTAANVLLVFACASQSRPKPVAVEEQSYSAAIQQICDVDTLAGVVGTSDELERSRLREDYIVENTKNGDAIFFATVWRTKLPSERAEMLAEQAAKARIARCALVDALREE